MFFQNVWQKNSTASAISVKLARLVNSVASRPNPKKNSKQTGGGIRMTSPPGKAEGEKKNKFCDFLSTSQRQQTFKTRKERTPKQDPPKNSQNPNQRLIN